MALVCDSKALCWCKQFDSWIHPNVEKLNSRQYCLTGSIPLPTHMVNRGVNRGIMVLDKVQVKLHADFLGRRDAGVFFLMDPYDKMIVPPNVTLDTPISLPFAGIFPHTDPDAPNTFEMASGMIGPVYSYEVENKSHSLTLYNALLGSRSGLFTEEALMEATDFLADGKKEKQPVSCTLCSEIGQSSYSSTKGLLIQMHAIDAPHRCAGHPIGNICASSPMGSLYKLISGLLNTPSMQNVFALNQDGSLEKTLTNQVSVDIPRLRSLLELVGVIVSNGYTILPDHIPNLKIAVVTNSNGGLKKELEGYMTLEVSITLRQFFFTDVCQLLLKLDDHIDMIKLGDTERVPNRLLGNLSPYALLKSIIIPRQ